MKDNILNRLEKEVLLCDGAMGTLLNSRGVPYDKCREEQNLVNPELVRTIHQEYIDAGAQIIETNTFSANRIKLRAFGLEDTIEEINKAAVKIAREAAGKEVYVAGSVGPLGVLAKPYGHLAVEEINQLFQEQIRYLVEAGVDLLIIETISSLLEAVEAISAAKKVSPSIPVVCMMTFLEDGKTKFGDEIANSLNKVKEAGADIVGVNCTIGPKETYDLVRIFIPKVDAKISIMPNAGYPTIVQGKTIFLSSPEYLKEYASLFVELGANIIGSCCGTTPEHTRAMAPQVRGKKPARGISPSPAITTAVRAEEIPRAAVAVEARRFSEKLTQGKFAITVEVDPPKGSDYNKMLEGAETLKSLGVDALNISDNPMARVRMSSIALAHLLQEEVGMQTILHFTCRDRNLLGLQSELIGASALGITAILALTGDPSSIGDFPKATSVFDVDSIGLVKIIKGLNDGKDLANNPIGRPTAFKIGVAVKPAAEELDLEIQRLEEKVKAGADFAQSQPIYDIEVVEHFQKKTAHLQIPLLVGILPLRSYRHAQFLHNEVPGIIISKNILKRMKKSTPEEEMREGLKTACEFVSQVKGLVDGFLFIPPFDKYHLVEEMIKAL